MKYLICIALFVLSSSPLAWAQDNERSLDEAYVREIENYITLSGEAQIYTNEVAFVFDFIEEDYLANQSLVDSLRLATLTKTQDDLAEMSSLVYLKYLTKDDLKQINKFYKSEVGKQYVKTNQHIATDLEEDGYLDAFVDRLIEDARGVQTKHDDNLEYGVDSLYLAQFNAFYETSNQIEQLSPTFTYVLEVVNMLRKKTNQQSLKVADIKNEYISALAPSYKKYLSVKDLEKLTKFYQAETGKRYAEITPIAKAEIALRNKQNVCRLEGELAQLMKANTPSLATAL